MTTALNNAVNCDYGPQVLRQWIEDACRFQPDKPCIIYAEDGRAITYRELRELTARIAGYLRNRGLTRNDRVALLADNSIEHLVCYFGVMAYGATVCTVHAEMNRNHLEQILAALKAQLILFDAELPQEELAHAPADACMALGKWHASASDTFFS